ncbi:unnamed protein product [Pleuronectes platessa]|uniref:Uncharacterized protein n=1 Tax=Pleuronectes platessa TaxID=8262 RepID=A0A9N7UUW8_PLEPL|nr:unnamed protein product [Pleuronectes platessa]
MTGRINQCNGAAWTGPGAPVFACGRFVRVNALTDQSAAQERPPPTEVKCLSREVGPSFSNHHCVPSYPAASGPSPPLLCPWPVCAVVLITPVSADTQHTVPQPRMAHSPPASLLLSVYWGGAGERPASEDPQSSDRCGGKGISSALLYVSLPASCHRSITASPPYTHQDALVQWETDVPLSPTGPVGDRRPPLGTFSDTKLSSLLLGAMEWTLICEEEGERERQQGGPRTPPRGSSPNWLINPYRARLQGQGRSA